MVFGNRNYSPIFVLCGLIAMGMTCICPSIAAHAQARASGCKTFGAQIGVAATVARPDFDIKYMAGISAFGDFQYKAHLGLEAEYHYLNLYTPLNIAENTVLFGPTYRFNVGRMHPYIKVLAGVATWKQLQSSQYATTTSRYYGTTAIGAGAYYNVSRHIAVRAELEHQDWFTYSPYSLTPDLLTVGVAYRIH